jgi:hypothetical protein
MHQIEKCGAVVLGIKLKTLYMLEKSSAMTYTLSSTTCYQQPMIRPEDHTDKIWKQKWLN